MLPSTPLGRIVNDFSFLPDNVFSIGCIQLFQLKLSGESISLGDKTARFMGFSPKSAEWVFVCESTWSTCNNITKSMERHFSHLITNKLTKHRKLKVKSWLPLTKIGWCPFMNESVGQSSRVWWQIYLPLHFDFSTHLPPISTLSESLQ